MDAVIRVYDEAGNVIETHEHAGNFRELFHLTLSALLTHFDVPATQSGLSETK